MFSFFLITALLCIVYLHATKDGTKGVDTKRTYLIDKQLSNFDKVVFLVAKKNGGVISIPSLCIEAGISAQEANAYLIGLEENSFVNSAYSKKLSQIVYYVNEYLTEENRKDLDVY